MATPGRKAPAKKRKGPPLGSANAIRHGLTCAALPKDARYIYHRMNRLRRTLEAAVLETKGEVNLTDAASIQTCLRWERAAQLAERYFRREGPKLDPVKAQEFLSKAALASEKRDKSIAALQLDQDNHQDILNQLYRQPQLPAPK